MHLGVAIWKDKRNRNYNRARHLVSPHLPSLKPLTGGKKNVSIQLICNHLQIWRGNPRSNSYCLYLASKKQTPRSLRTDKQRELEGASAKNNGMGTKLRPKTRAAASGVIWMFTCWIFYQFCFYLYPNHPHHHLSFCVIYAAGTELCIGAAWSWLEQW